LFLFQATLVYQPEEAESTEKGEHSQYILFLLFAFSSKVLETLTFHESLSLVCGKSGVFMRNVSSLGGSSRKNIDPLIGWNDFEAATERLCFEERIGSVLR